ncbi:unnamed protein product, partial [marine sediment metagenome]
DEIVAIAEKGGIIGLVTKSNWIKINGLHKGTTVNNYLDHFDHVINLVGIDHVGIGLDIGGANPPLGKYPHELSDESLFTQRFPELTGPTADHPMYTPGYPIENVHPVDLSPPYPKTINITRGLVARGYSDKDILKVLGGNFLRVFKKVWK